MERRQGANPGAAFLVSGTVVSSECRAATMSVHIEPEIRAGGRLAEGGGSRKRLARFARPLMAIELAGCEITVISLLFSFEVNLPYWQHPAYWLRHLQMLVIVAAIAWAIMMWPRRGEIAEVWTSAAEGRGNGWGVPLAVNLGLFAVLSAATFAFTLHAASAPEPPWGWFALYCIPLAATALSLFWLFAPIRFWTELVRRQTREIAIALATGAILLAGGGLAQTGWDQLAGTSLMLAHALLSLYEPTAAVDYAMQSLSVRDFKVIIDQSCSGYEGMALVAAFLGLYLWSFRQTLRFPNALLLLPLGVASIYALNIVRIAALVSIGGHVSPDVAEGGFHSQAGWMAFLAVALGLMALAPRIAFFAHQKAAPAQSIGMADRSMDALLVPFMALMGGSIVASASAPYDTWLYGLKIAAAGVALYVLRGWYRGFAVAISPVAVSAGVVVGAAWIATDAGGVAPSGLDLGTWLSAQPPVLAAAWLAIRAFGGIVVVPVVEEFAFRGVFYRWIISRRFEAVAFDRFSWLALLVSSGLFGLLHSRPLAGTAAGAVFCLVMVRRGRLADAIAAHVAANAVIIAWAIGMRQWTLL